MEQRRGGVRDTPGTNRLPRAVNPQQMQGTAFLCFPLGEAEHMATLFVHLTQEKSLFVQSMVF